MDVTQPRRITKINHPELTLTLDSIVIEVHGVIYSFEPDDTQEITKITKVLNPMNGDALSIQELAPMPHYRFRFAACVIHDRYVLITGGKNLSGAKCAEVFVFDT